MRVGGAVFIVGAALTACTTGVNVEAESRSAIPVESSPTTISSTGATTTTVAPPPEPELPSVVFDLERFDLEVTWRRTIADTPPNGYNGFHTAAELADGSLIASGFDAWGDGSRPERSALWRSSDGEFWERIGIDDVSGQPDQQSIASLVVGNGTVLAYGGTVDASGLPIAFDSVRRWTTRDDGTTWSEIELLRGASINRAALVDESIVTVGVADANLAGGYSGEITVESNDRDPQSTATDIDDSGAITSGSEIRDLLALPDQWLLTGGTTITDLSAAGDELFAEANDLDFPSDVGLWSSTNDGETWERLEIDRFADVPGAQHGERLRYDGERFWLMTVEQGFGVFGVNLYTSADALSWTLHPYRRPDFPEAGDDTSAHDLFLVEGAVVIVDEVDDAERSEPHLMMTVIDPDTDEMVSIDITAELGGLHQVGEIIQVDEQALGFGRVDRGTAESALQVVEIRRIEPDQEPDDPSPTTAPPSGGGSSDA